MRKKKKKLSWIAECIDSKKGHYMVWVFDKESGDNVLWRHVHCSKDNDLIGEAEAIVVEAHKCE